MVLIHQILRQIRINQSYDAKAIAKALSLSVDTFRELEYFYSNISSKFLLEWLRQLDIPTPDRAWFIQAHLREQYYRNLPSHLSEPLRRKLADIITLHAVIDSTALIAQLTKHTLPHLLRRPRSADVAIDDISESKQ